MCRPPRGKATAHDNRPVRTVGRTDQSPEATGAPGREIAGEVSGARRNVQEAKHSGVLLKGALLSAGVIAWRKDPRRKLKERRGLSPPCEACRGWKVKGPSSLAVTMGVASPKWAFCALDVGQFSDSAG